MRTCKNFVLSGGLILSGIALLLPLFSSCHSVQVDWVSDFEEALRQASEKDTLVFLDISASW